MLVQVGLERIGLFDGADKDFVEIHQFHLLGHSAEPHHHAGLAQRGEVLLEQAAPSAAIVVLLQFLFAATLITAAIVPDLLNDVGLGIARLSHQDNQVFVVLADAARFNGRWVEGHAQL